MTVAVNDRLSGPYTGNGATVAFAYDFRIEANTELRVILRSVGGVDTVQTLTTHYTVSGVSVDAGGNVTFVTAPATGEKVIVEGVKPLTQTANYVETERFPYDSHQSAMDNGRRMDQELRRDLDRALKYPHGETVYRLPVKPTTTAKYLMQETDGSIIHADTPLTQAVEDEYLIGTPWTATGDGATLAFTRTCGVSRKDQIDIYVDGRRQNNSTYTVSLNTGTGVTTFTFDSALVSQTNGIQFVPKIAYSVDDPTLNSGALVTATGSTTARTLADRFADIVHKRTRAQLQALTAAQAPAGSRWYMTDAYRFGSFVAVSTDQSALVTADAQQGVFIPYSGASSGASGGFLRESIDRPEARWFGATGDGSTDDSTAMTAFVAYCNYAKVVGYPGKGSFVYGTTLTFTANSSGLIGEGQGNVANLTPAAAAPTQLLYTGSGSAIWLKGQECCVTDLRVSASGSRATDTFDITKPGIRIEAVDTTGETGRADRCLIDRVRVDKQPGDGILTVGEVTGSTINDVEVYDCRGFGLRGDDGSYTGIVRTNKQYPGLMNIKHIRVGFCGGHAIALSNPTVTTQAGMAIRVVIDQLDSFGNARNTSIMYASTDGLYYDVWIFGENCELRNSAPCGFGYDGSALTNEDHAGVWIAGRDNVLHNNRYVDTTQPIYWGYISAQPSTGLVVDGVRLTQTSLVHDQLVKLESGSARGLHIRANSKGVSSDHFTRFAGPQTNTTSVGVRISYQGQDNVDPKASGQSVDDDDVLTIPIFGATSSIVQQFILALAPTAVASGGGMFHCRVGSATPKATKWSGETNTVAHGSGVALTGTTGTDGQLTVSCDDTSLYIENRLGFAVTLNYQMLACNMASGLLA